jgi:hypothetical protein
MMTHLHGLETYCHGMSLALQVAAVSFGFTFQEDKKKKKKERVKLVVLNTDEQSHVIEASPVPANHLEEIQPQGDQQLKQKGAVS